jgi:hypothetical protein
MGAALATALLLVCYPVPPAIAGGFGGAKPPADRTELLTQYQPWEPEKEDAASPSDPRLATKLSVAQPKITIGELLADVHRQTKVKLTAFEPELQSQALSVYAADLRLDVLMVQMAHLLGLYWYQRTQEGEREYVVSYGSSPPSLTAKQEVAERDAYWRNMRASRIADYVHALTLSEEELRELAKSDPALAGSLLKWPGTRYGTEALTAFRPETLRKLIETGEVTVGSDELPSWFADGIRANYKEGQWSHLGIESADVAVRQCRLRFAAPDWVLGPQDIGLYDLWGPMWHGISCGACVFPVATGKDSPDKPVGLSWMPFVPEEAQVRGTGWLLGKMEDMKRAEAQFPELLGVDTDKSWEDRLQDLVTRGEQERRAQIGQCPWKDDPLLSETPSFALSPQVKTTDMLKAVAKQTRYAVIGTYFEAQDPLLPAGVSADEPLYVLLNRAAQSGKCSWSLQGNVIRWLHNDWFVFEAERASTGPSSR